MAMMLAWYVLVLLVTTLANLYYVLAVLHGARSQDRVIWHLVTE